MAVTESTASAKKIVESKKTTPPTPIVSKDMTIEEKLDEILDRKEVTNEDLVNAMSMFMNKT